MKILAISGSPRDGNTDAILKKLLNGAKSAGASIELVKLREKDIKECDGCLYCDKANACKIQDGMQQLLGKMRQVDVIVLGTPSYFDNVTGTMKKFMDRTNPFYQIYPLKNKKMAAVIVGGQSIEKQEIVLQTMKKFAEFQKMQYAGEVIAEAEKAREVLQNEEVMQKCFEFGKRLVTE